MSMMSTRFRQTVAKGVVVALAVSGLSVIGASAASATPTVNATCAWSDTTKTPDERARLLLDASTVEQKYRWLVEQAANNPAQTTFSGVTFPAQVDCTPTVTYTDGPDGIRFTDGVTAFPAQISLASTWNSDLSFAKGAATGAEAFDKGKLGVLGPGIGSGRTPLSGRTAEYLGEDSLLSGVLAAANTNGIEDGNPDKPAMAVMKHFVANEQELDRQTSSSNVDERTLRQVYELPYEILFDQGAPEGVMCSYNQINGVYGCENPILTSNLRDALGFDGYVVSDFGAVHSTAASLNAGMDQELNRPIYYTPEKLNQALTAGEITEDRIDSAAFAVVKSYIRAGLFDAAPPSTPVADASTADHKQLALQIAEEGTVLLKNDSTLPLSVESGQSIAVIGATASNTPTGGVSTKTVCSMGWAFGGGNTMNCEDVESPLDAITERAAQDGATVTFDPGTDPATAAAVAAEADVVVVFGYRKSGEFSDIPDLSLQAGGDDLIAAVAAANPNTVAVLETGSATDMPWLDSVGAVFQAWYPGEQQGPALANLLWGDTNPSGKLPMTFPRSLADTPTNTPEQYPGVFADGSTTRTDSTEIRQVNYTEGLEVGYKWYDQQGIDPLFEFGHGLSYTDFEYSDLELTTTVDPESRAVTTVADFTVANTGERDGTEIAQVYLTLPEVADEPGKRLVGFQRVTLAAGTETRVSLPVESESSAHPFSVYDAEGAAWITNEGDYTVQVGGSSRDLTLNASAAVDFTPITPEPVVLTNTTKPSFSGQPKAGTKLTANPGTWTPTPTKFTYRWLRDGKPIAGATAKTYRVTTKDAGNRISVTVTATKSGSAKATATSKSSAVGKLKSSVKPTLRKSTITAKQRAVVTVKVTVTPSERATGSVTVKVGGKTKSVTLRSTDRNSVKLTLPKLSKGKYTVKVSYSGSDAVKASSAKRTLRVR